MILMTPAIQDGIPGWTQARVEAPRGGGGQLTRLGRLLRRVAEPGLVEQIAARAGGRLGWPPSPDATLAWAPEPGLSPFVSDAEWRQEQIRLHERPAAPHRPAPELCWLWSPASRRWETPLFLLRFSEPGAARLALSFHAAASLLWLWDAEALRLADEWGPELSAQDLLDFARPMSAHGMRLLEKECFGAGGPDFEPSELHHWRALLEAKELDLAVNSPEGEDSKKEWL